MSSQFFQSAIKLFLAKAIPEKDWVDYLLLTKPSIEQNVSKEQSRQI